MSKNWFSNLVVIISLFGFLACDFNKKRQVEKDVFEKKTILKYAKGFEIYHYANYKKLIIKNPYQGANKNFTFKLVKNSTAKNAIEVPLKKIVATSTTHIPMLELLGVEKKCLKT